MVQEMTEALCGISFFQRPVSSLEGTLDGVLSTTLLAPLPVEHKI